WLQRRDVSHAAALDQRRERRHLPGVEQWRDDLPIGGVPPDEQNAAARLVHVRHAKDNCKTKQRTRCECRGLCSSCIETATSDQARRRRAINPTAPAASKPSDVGSGTPVL